MTIGVWVWFNLTLCRLPVSPTIAGHLKLTLRLLALKACENGSDRLEEEEANYVVEYGGSDCSDF